MDPEGETWAFSVEHAIPYVELPILLRFEPNRSGGWGPHFLAGPSLALRVGGDIDVEWDEPLASLSRKPRIRAADIFEEVGTFDDIDPDYGRWDVGVVGGAGIGFGGDATRYLAEVRWSRGYVEVFPHNFIGDSKNGAWAFLLGVEWR